MKCLICNKKAVKSAQLGGNPIYFCRGCRHYFCPAFVHEKTYNVYENYEYSLKELRLKNYSTMLNKLAPLLPAGAVGLEVGSALGWFLDECANKGYKMLGIEPIKINYEKSLNEENYEVINGYFPECLNSQEASFDFIVFNDVFEHIADANAIITACSKLLKKSGLLIINLPMNTGIFYKTSKIFYRLGKKQSMLRLWQFETESPHLHYFSSKSLNITAKRGGFSLLSQFNLRSVLFSYKNINERLTGIGKTSKFKAAAASLIILASAPLFALLPKDIKCFIFQKN